MSRRPPTINIDKSKTGMLSTVSLITVGGPGALGLKRVLENTMNFDNKWDLATLVACASLGPLVYGAAFFSSFWFACKVYDWQRRRKISLAWMSVTTVATCLLPALVLPMWIVS